MVKSGVSNKQSMALASVKPIGSNSTLRNQSPTSASSNFRVVFEVHPTYNDAIKLLIKFIQSHPLFGAFDSFMDVVPLPTLLRCDFSAFLPNHNSQEVHLTLIEGSMVVLTKSKFLEATNLRVPPNTQFCNPSTADIITTLYQMGYQKKIKGIG